MTAISSKIDFLRARLGLRTLDLGLSVILNLGQGTQMFYMGSLMIALAVEESGISYSKILDNVTSINSIFEIKSSNSTFVYPILHNRLALRALMLSGDAISSIMLGFMCVTAFLSMWISNAATTAMMMPIL